MHAEHQNTQDSQRDNSTTMAPVDEALADLDSLEPGESLCYAQSARKYGVDRSTLSRRYRAITQPRATQYQERRNLTLHEEVELVRYIEGLLSRYLLPTRSII